MLIKGLKNSTRNHANGLETLPRRETTTQGQEVMGLSWQIPSKQPFLQLRRTKKGICFDRLEFQIGRATMEALVFKNEKGQVS